MKSIMTYLQPGSPQSRLGVLQAWGRHTLNIYLSPITPKWKEGRDLYLIAFYGGFTAEPLSSSCQAIAAAAPPHRPRTGTESGFLCNRKDLMTSLTSKAACVVLAYSQLPLAQFSSACLAWLPITIPYYRVGRACIF